MIGDNGTTELADLVGGWSAFVTYDFLERFKLIGEYVGSLDDFEAGEIYAPALDKKRKPTAWNVELGVLILETAVRSEPAARVAGGGISPHLQHLR